MEMKGILTDTDTGDLALSRGTVRIGDNTGQCIGQILVSARGEYKEHPLVGGELCRLLHGSMPRFWSGRAGNMCAAMGIPVRRVSVSGNGMIRAEV